jgi:hypothetical protein
MGQHAEEISAQAKLRFGCVSSSASASRYRSRYEQKGEYNSNQYCSNQPAISGSACLVLVNFADDAHL